MKKHTLILSLFALLLSSCQVDQRQKQIENIADEIIAQFAPDKRVALFNIDTIIPGSTLIVKGETNIPEAKEMFLKKLTEQNITIIDSLVVLPSVELEGKHFGIVNVSVGNLRSKRGHSQELATQAMLGTALRVWKEDNGFFLVQTPDDYFGWMDDGGFQLMEQNEFDNWQNAPKLTVLEDYVFAYEHPDFNSQKVSDLLAGNIVLGTRSNGNFTQVNFPDGRVGFVQTEKLMPYSDWLSTREPSTTNLLTTAKELMGRPYLWGGTSGKGVDCSGFTKTIYYLNGLLLPRDASQQVMVGDEVETDSTFSTLQPGDFLFFGRKANEEQKERITHVGIYMGDGKMIHSANKVEVISLLRGEPGFSEYRLKSFVRAKRLTGSGVQNAARSLAETPYY